MFVKKVVKMRTEAKKTGDEAKSLTAKLFGNSSYGKTGEAVSKYRNTSIIFDDDEFVEKKKSALFKSSNPVISEDNDQVAHEVSMLSKKVDDNKPVHVAVTILQNAKLLFLR